MDYKKKLAYKKAIMLSCKIFWLLILIFLSFLAIKSGMSEAIKVASLIIFSLTFIISLFCITFYYLFEEKERKEIIGEMVRKIVEE